jgi:hypothetical protein
MCLEKLSNDILYIILEYFYLYDIKTISKLSQTNKHFNKLCMDRRVWILYYKSLFNCYKIGDQSEHMGDQSYSKCRLGNYPGWTRVYDPIPVEIDRCKNVDHYAFLEKTEKSVKWKNHLFKMCARRTFTKKSKYFFWNRDKEYKLKRLQKQQEKIKRKIKSVERYKEKSLRIQCVFLPHITKTQNKKLF